MYHFYGNEENIMDGNGLDIRECYDILKHIWSKETCAPRMRDQWTKDNPSLGQCSVTALVAQDYFGGEIVGIELPDGNYHCFNLVNGSVFDLTSEQFPQPFDYTKVTPQKRSKHLANAEKRQRYHLLSSRYAEYVPQIKQANPEHARDYVQIYREMGIAAQGEDAVEKILAGEDVFALEYATKDKVYGFLFGHIVPMEGEKAFCVNELGIVPEKKGRYIEERLLKEALAYVEENKLAGLQLSLGERGFAGIANGGQA